MLRAIFRVIHSVLDGELQVYRCSLKSQLAHPRILRSVRRSSSSWTGVFAEGLTARLSSARTTGLTALTLPHKTSTSIVLFCFGESLVAPTSRVAGGALQCPCYRLTTFLLCHPVVRLASRNFAASPSTALNVPDGD